MDKLKTFGRLLARRRNELNLSQTELAETVSRNIGCRQSDISDLEQGKPTIQMLRLFDIAEALNCDVKLIPKE